MREQLPGVDEIPGMADGDRPAVTETEGRLGVLPDRRPGGRIAAVGDSERAPKARQAALVEDLGDESEVLVEHQLLTVADSNSGRLLAAVLEREDAERGHRGRVRAGHHRAKDAAHVRRPIRSPATPPDPGGRPRRGLGPRSYTHLTLPT